jgi:methyl-accepting chemotaxis protein
MNPHTASHPASSPQADLSTIGRFADAVLLGALGVSALAALAIGQTYGHFGLALGVAGALLAAGAGAYALARGSTLAWVVLTTANVAMVALHIQLGRGTLEFHFGVFVLLGLLLVYRNWRPVVLAAALVAVHHIVFDRLQAMGVAVYCTPEPNFLVIVMHAAYVVVQTSLEVLLAVSLRRSAQESAELNALVHSLDREGRMCLDLQGLQPASGVGRALQAALVKMAQAVRR